MAVPETAGAAQEGYNFFLGWNQVHKIILAAIAPPRKEDLLVCQAWVSKFSAVQAPGKRDCARDPAVGLETRRNSSGRAPPEATPPRTPHPEGTSGRRQHRCEPGPRCGTCPRYSATPGKG